ncbi:helix-turn-helix domain-containing protein [Okeania sp.]|uniref:winged helix-turn-helix transcriptional regulator n=1 Tax=Okeania sp. TaxID=3100323 RepID=UPI002B4B425E|nr:helix-turn-helix domain-containing protein [Okeania sp.]MEB3341887.1 helix-turn-helix domain-containing protein [Okeania sp.]
MKVQNKSVKSNAEIPNIFCLSNNCPIQFVLRILGTKWSVLILRELLSGDRRTHELLEALPGISSKTLTLRLRQLEKHGLLARRVYAEVPPHVEYSLTEKGLQVQPVMMAIKQLGEQWLEHKNCTC